MIDDELWKIDRTAKRLGCSEAYVRRLVFERRISYIKLGARTLRFDPESINKWLRDRIMVAVDD